MKLLVLIITAGAVLHLSSAQFRQQNNQRFRFDSDEFDNDFDDLFDRRSRERNSFERNSIERDSDEVIGNIRNISPARLNSLRQSTFNRNGFRDDSFEVDRFGRITIDRDSDEIRNVGRNRSPFVQNRNQVRNFVQNRNTFSRDSDEIPSNRRRPASRFGFDSDEIRTVGNQRNAFRFDDSIEVIGPGGRRISIERDSFEVRRPGFRRNSIERDSFEIRTPLTRNRNPFRQSGFRVNSIERDSFEIRTPLNRNRNPFRQSGLRANSIEIDSPEDIIEDLFDDDADDRARARLALQQLQRRGQLPSAFGGNRQFGAQSSSFGQPRNPFTTSNVQQTNRNTISRNPAPRNPFVPTTPRPQFQRTQNRLTSFNRSPGRPLSSTNTRTNSSPSGAQFPPLPVSPFRSRTPVRTPSVNTIVSTANNNPSRNSNRLSVTNNRLNFNNPFLSRPSSGRPLPVNQPSNLRPIPPLPAINRNPPTFTTTPRPVVATRITTPRPAFTTRRIPTRPPAPTTPRRTPRPIPTTTPRPFRPTSAPRPFRPTSAPRPFRPTQAPRQNFNSNRNSLFNPFQTAARLNNAISSSSQKPSNNPFIRSGAGNSIRSGDTKLGSVGGFSRKKAPKKTLPAVVPMGFEWPGGNGYFFRMSTGNSKPIQYFISYDD